MPIMGKSFDRCSVSFHIASLPRDASRGLDRVASSFSTGSIPIQIKKSSEIDRMEISTLIFRLRLRRVNKSKLKRRTMEKRKVMMPPRERERHSDATIRTMTNTSKAFFENHASRAERRYLHDVDLLLLRRARRVRR